jgi:hypothetical protein
VKIEELADRCGALAWIANELFLLEGQLAPTVANPAFAAHLAEASRHYGWHAEQWRQQLPDSPALAAADRIVPPAGWVERIEKVRAATTERRRATILATQVLPQLHGLITSLELDLDGPGDRSALRLAGIVRADVMADLYHCQRARDPGP